MLFGSVCMALTRAGRVRFLPSVERRRTQSCGLVVCEGTQGTHLQDSHLLASARACSSLRWVQMRIYTPREPPVMAHAAGGELGLYAPTRRAVQSVVCFFRSSRSRGLRHRLDGGVMLFVPSGRQHEAASRRPGASIHSAIRVWGCAGPHREGFPLGSRDAPQARSNGLVDVCSREKLPRRKSCDSQLDQSFQKDELVNVKVGAEGVQTKRVFLKTYEQAPSKIKSRIYLESFSSRFLGPWFRKRTSTA